MSSFLSSPYVVTAAASNIVSPSGSDTIFLGVVDNSLVIGNGPSSDIAISLEANDIYFTKDGVKTSLQAEMKGIDDALAAGVVTDCAAEATNAANISDNTDAIGNNSSNIVMQFNLISEVENSVSDNAGSISSNTTSINTNTNSLISHLDLISDAATAVAENKFVIENHTVHIANNTTNITNNTVNISTNDADIASLNLNKQNTLTNGVQNLTSAEVSQLANIGTSNISDVDWRGVQYLGNVQYDVNTKFNDKLNKFGDIMTGALNMSNNDIYNPGLIGGYDLATFDSDISSLALNLGTETTRALNAEAALASDIAAINVNIPQITTNQTEIATNAADIVAVSGLAAANAAAVTLHGLDIYQNGLDITALDASKLSKSGGVMTGTLEATSIDFTGSLNTISALELSRLDNITSNVQTQLNSRVTTSTGLQNLTTSEVNQLKNIGTYVISSTAWRGAQYLTNITYDIHAEFGTKQDVLSNGVASLTTSEVNQLKNIGTYVIASTDWRGLQYMGNVQYDVNERFNTKQNTITNGVQNLTSAEVEQLSRIATAIIGTTDWLGLQYLTSVTYDVNTKFNQKLDLTGGTMTGNIAMGDNAITLVDNSVTSTITTSDLGSLRMVNSSGILFESSLGNPRYEFPIGVSTSTPCRLKNHVYIDNSLEVNSGLTVDGSITTLEGYTGLMAGNVAYNQLRIQHPLNTTYGWNLGNQTNISTSSSDMDLFFSVSRGSFGSRIAAALYDERGGTGPINFTGQHRCQPTFEFKESMVGLIVESTGRYMNFIEKDVKCSQKRCIQPNDALPIVDICGEMKSSRVLGVISGEEELNRNYQAGVFASFYDKLEYDNRIYVNSIGEGSIWVCDMNGELKNGDYICAAGFSGYGMKQDSEFLANYTVAKITMHCDFQPEMEQVKICRGVDEENKELIWEYLDEYEPQYECRTLDNGTKIALVGCTYHCG